MTETYCLEAKKDSFVLDIYRNGLKFEDVNKDEEDNSREITPTEFINTIVEGQALNLTKVFVKVHRRSASYEEETEADCPASNWYVGPCSVKEILAYIREVILYD